jgi:hypothetical protein
MQAGYTSNQSGEPTGGQADRRKGKVSKGSRLVGVGERQATEKETEGKWGDRQVVQRDRHN